MSKVKKQVLQAESVCPVVKRESVLRTHDLGEDYLDRIHRLIGDLAEELVDHYIDVHLDGDPTNATHFKFELAINAIGKRRLVDG